MQLSACRFIRVVAVCGPLSLFWSCGGEKTETKTITVEPVAKTADLKPALRLTTFPNNRFTGPGGAGEVTTIGFPCDTNPYKDKEISLRYQGYLKIDRDGTYVFRITSDDQCKLKLGPAIVVDNEESTKTKEGSANLKAGLYPLEIDYQNNVGPACLEVTWTSESAGGGWEPIAAAQLLHE